MQPLPLSSSAIDQARVSSRPPVIPAEQSSVSASSSRAEQESGGSLVSDVSSRSAALRNLGEGLRLAQVADQALTFVSSQLGKVSDSVGSSSPDQGYVDAVASGTDAALGSLPPSARPMMPSPDPQSTMLFVEMSAQSLLPSWSRGASLPTSDQVGAAQALVADTQAHLASSRSELVQAATTVGLVGPGQGLERPSDAEISALAASLAAPGATQGTHDASHSSALRALLP